MRLKFILNNGKNPKWKYFLGSYLYLLIPPVLLRRRCKRILRSLPKREDYKELTARRDYYCNLSPGTPLGPDAGAIRAIKPKRQKVYAFDTLRYARWFPLSLKLRLLPGDITYVPEHPSVMKSRPIAPAGEMGRLANSTLLKLDRVRHFIFTKDNLPFREKKDMALFRGKVGGKEARRQLMLKYHGHRLVDAGDVGRNPEQPQWATPKLTIGEQLEYKFILAIEGNDVASNLKWVMSSNSVAVMPRPTYETWFMEGTLIPGYHYVEIKPDYTDLEEKLEYYLGHPEEAEEISRHANRYVDRFRDHDKERAVSLLVLQKYFECTGQAYQPNNLTNLQSNDG